MKAAAPLTASWRPSGEIEHVFTHFSLTLQVWRAQTSKNLAGAIWTPAERLDAQPSVFLKAAREATSP